MNAWEIIKNEFLKGSDGDVERVHLTLSAGVLLMKLRESLKDGNDLVAMMFNDPDIREAMRIVSAVRDCLAEVFDEDKTRA